MSDDPRPSTHAAGEAPPLLAGLLLGAGRQASKLVRTFVQRTSRGGLVYRIVIGGALAIAIGLPAFSIAQDRSLVDVVGAIFAGLFLALVVGAGSLWIAVSVLRPARGDGAAAAALAGELEGLLAPSLRELEVLRAEATRAVKRRSAVGLPVGILIGVVLYVSKGGQASDPFDLLVTAFVGALFGEGWAMWKPDRDYRRAFKTRVLPQLARRFGDLIWRPASKAEVARLGERGILPRHHYAEVEDEITGTHHGLPVSLVEVQLALRIGKRRRVVFDGLLVRVGLPRGLTAITAIGPDRGPVGNLKAQWRASGLQRVRLEDPRFEQRYEVFGNDPIEARALLTPAFTERFVALERLAGMSPPGAMTEGNELTIALPKRERGDLFEPPPYWKPAGGDALVQLSRDIEGVLAMADAVISLDFWAAGRRNDAAQRSFGSSA